MSVPGWLWMSAGVLIGIGVAWGIARLDAALLDPVGATGGRTASSAAAREGAAGTRGMADASPGKAGTGASSAPDRASAREGATATRFEFYRLLPEMEVKVGDETVPERRRASPGQGGRGPGEGRTGSPDAASLPVYVVQAGSFRSREDADRLRANLALIGVEAEIQRVSRNGQVWHRVRIGPLRGEGALRRVRSRLAELALDPMVMRTAASP